MKTDVTIRKALMADLDSVMNIYAEARQYMKEQGNPEQWGEDYPQISLVEADIAAGKCYVCGSDGSIGAAFYFAVENDKSYDVIEDGSWRNDRAYGVVHRIAVGENMHNHGIAGQCIAYAVAECKKQNIYDLRMDTHNANIPMQKFLEKQDFRRCGKVYMEDGSERIAYHKIIICNVVF